MEARQIQCDNIGMNRDNAISALGKDKSGITNFAFENFNIRIMANNDNTAMAVTNEKSTKAELTGPSALPGVFLGGCKLNSYLVLFLKDPNANANHQDSIYRIHYDGTTLRPILLYNGNLNFNLWNPIEAIGYYESEEVQKVYWVDGYNPNRFINIAKTLFTINGTTYNSKSIEDIILPDGVLHALATTAGVVSYYYYEEGGITTVWSKSDVDTAIAAGASNVAGLKVRISTIYSMTVSGQGLYAGKLNPFDFQGSIAKIPTATITKNYNEAGNFQAGVIQYFFTYYNKYGVETCIIWNSDLQYISMQDRGAKQDENVACGFDFEIDSNSLDAQNYQYLRIYACYRSSLNVVAAARLVTEISIADLNAVTVPKLYFADLGTVGETVNAADLKYLGGQNIIASTLDYKQDTMFLGNLKVPSDIVNTHQPTMVSTTVAIPKGPEVTIKRIKTKEVDRNATTLVYIDTFNYLRISDDANEVLTTQAEFEAAALANGVVPADIPNTDVMSYKYVPAGNTTIQECPGISWAYKMVSDHKPAGVYSYKSEMQNSQEEIAGFKWRELYRFGIQFMTPTGEWTSAQWIGDKYCDLPPMNIAKIPLMIYNPTTKKEEEVLGFEADGLQPKKINKMTTVPNVVIVNKATDAVPVSQGGGSLVLRSPSRSTRSTSYKPGNVQQSFEQYNPEYKAATPDVDGVYHLLNYKGQTGFNIDLIYESDGYYMATAIVDLTKIFPDAAVLADLKSKYIGYRLLMADMDMSSRRIISQGIINPTMFNYNDRYYNRPYSIPSWIFRPRLSKLTNRHFDTLPMQTEETAELQGIISRRLPGFDEESTKVGSYNAYMFIIAANDGGSYMQWKLIYYNSAHEVTASSFKTWLSNKGFPYQTDTDKMLANLDYMMEESERVAKNGGSYNISEMFGSDYMVVSSGKVKEIAGKWDTIAGSFLGTLVNDIKSKKDPQGGELPLVFSSSMLPDGALLKDIAFCKGDAALIWAIIGLVIAAVAAAVASVFTAGAAAAAVAGVGTALAAVIGTVTPTVAAVCAALTPIIACAAVAGAAGAAAIAQNMDKFQEVDRKMMSKNFFPINTNHGLTGDNNRAHTDEKIQSIFQTFFKTITWDDDYVGLKGDQDSPFTMRASTRDDSIGMDWNAYISGGALRFTSAEEEDLKRKANLFCIDESIVTLNSPDVEDIANSVENSEAYDLHIVGMIPVHSAYGIYDLQCTQGLASAAEVLRNRFIVPKSIPGTEVEGLLNGDFYQDTDITEAEIVGCLITDKNGAQVVDSANPPVATPNVALYRQWMWNRETSIGMWLPGVPMQDALGNKIQIPPSQPTHKLFANMRYSFDTLYRNPFTMAINAPSACLDEQVMLKSFTRAGGEKFYYENVNTISTNYKNYYLVKNRAPYPKAVEGIPLQTIAALYDPVQIKYKETPHILIPIKDHDGVSHILPYTVGEESISPYKLYGSGDRNLVAVVDANGNYVKENGKTKYRSLLNHVILEGVRTDFPMGSNTYRYLHTIKVDSVADDVDLLGEFMFQHADDPVGTPFRFKSSHGWTNITNNDDAKAALIACLHLELYRAFTTTYESSYSNAKAIFNLIVRRSLLELAAHQPYPIYKQAPDKARTDTYTYLINSNDVAIYELEVTGSNSAYTDSGNPTVRIRQLIGDRNDTYKFTVSDRVIVQKYPIKGPENEEDLKQISMSEWGHGSYGGSSLCYVSPDVLGGVSGYSQRIHNAYPNEYIDFSIFSAHMDKRANALGWQKVIHGDVYQLTDGATSLFMYDYPDDANQFTVNYPDNLDNYFGDAMRFQTWDQELLKGWSSGGYPFLFMGELVRKVFNYDTWMGGTQNYALKQLHWNVASPITAVSATRTRRAGGLHRPVIETIYPKILHSWGDTFYQRWDCLKTYPFTEDDKNSIVEVLSFMLETHQNLDGRSDVNRGISNLLNTRPYNTMFNPVYGQKDNFFSYSILDEKFEKSTFEADIAWSLTKNNMSDVDSWTSIMAVNQMSMEGRLGAVRKILNMGDALLVFQDTGLSMVKYNEEVALNSAEGLPVQLGNTGKVTGYRIISDVIGCHNKFSINKNSAGVFFTDDYNKAFMQYSQTAGIKDLGQEAGFSEWFRENISGNIWTPKTRDAFRTSYDEVTHDLYIITDKDSQGCLVYNTLLQKFTSFMSYIDTPMIVRLNSSNDSGAFAIRNNRGKVEAWQLFRGNGYNSIFGRSVPYSVEYRINPDPTHDSIFTNYQFTADWVAPTKAADSHHLFGNYSTARPARNPAATLQRRYTTFDTVEAWNEFQYGKKQVDTGRIGRFPVKSKFRIWRGDIPRDGENIGKKLFMPDRMRNPWIHLRFEKLASGDDSKMIFHNLVVNYYNQYGRI